VLELPLKGLQMALGLGALVLGATTAVSFASSARHALDDPPRVGAAPSASAEASWSRYQVIVDRNLFRTRAEPPAAPSEPTVQDSQLQVQLVGTLVAGKSEKPRPARKASRKPKRLSAKQRARLVSPAPPGSLAIVRDTDGSVRSLAVGDEFAEKRARLVAIERTRIVFENGGKLEAVGLAEAAPPAKAGRPGPPLPAAAPPQGARPSSMSALSALGMLDRLLLGGRPELAASGQLEAYRVGRVDPASGLGALLQEGDRVRAIDGIPLQQPGLNLRLQALLQQSSELRLTVEDASGRGREVPVPREAIDRVLNAGF
jgi:type II secretory pathway component PulC